jgi:transcriptional regulator with XRE-family HTH domain
MSAVLRMIMAKHQITTKAIHFETGISRGNLSRIINGHQNPTLDNCYLITEAICELSGKNYKIDTLFPHVSKPKRYA